MKARDVLVVVAAALATAALILAPGAMMGRATAAPKGAVRASVTVPTLKTKGVELTLTSDKKTYAPGDKPILTLKATNLRNQPASVSVVVSMTSTSLAAMVSRTMRLPSPGSIWSTSCKIALGPGETKTLDVPTSSPVAAGTMVSFAMGTGKGAIVAGKAAVPLFLLRGAVQATQTQR